MFSVRVGSRHAETCCNAKKHVIDTKRPACTILRDIDLQWLGLDINLLRNRDDLHNINYLAHSPTQKSCQNLSVGSDNYNRCITKNTLQHDDHHLVLEVYKEEASTTESEPSWNYRLFPSEEPPPRKSSCRTMPWAFLSYFY